jgi:hypothetical protein
MSDPTPADEMRAAADRLETLRGGRPWFHTTGPGDPLLWLDRYPQTDQQLGNLGNVADAELVVAAVNAAKHLPALLRYAAEVVGHGDPGVNQVAWQRSTVDPVHGMEPWRHIYAVAQAVNRHNPLTVDRS